MGRTSSASPHASRQAVTGAGNPAIRSINEPFCHWQESMKWWCASPRTAGAVGAALREQQRRARLWVVVTQWVSVFCIRTSRGAKVLWELLGEEYGGVLTSDRAKAYNGQPLHRHQVCWAHLRRDFQAMIDRGGAAAGVG